MSRPHFHFVTLFPDAIQVWLTTSILGRAHAQGLFGFTVHQLRDFAINKYGSVDDVAYGGGGGMVLRVEPLVAAVEKIRADVEPAETITIYFSPAGKRIDTDVIESFVPQLSTSHFILVCGHYEGADQRFVDHWVDYELSFGDFVVTGGELPAVAFTDGLIRHLDGTLSTATTAQTESFSLRDPSGRRQLEYPHYTRPQDFRGYAVPDVLVSGNHQRVAEWRQEQSRSRTERVRPDLTVSPR